MNIQKVFVIAEIGVNHNGSLVLAKEMIEDEKVVSSASPAMIA